MLEWIIVFCVLALIAALFGFGGLARGFAGIAKIIFFIFVIVLVVSLILGMMNGW